MALEDLTGTKYLDSLVSTNPVGATDPKSEGDDHIRGIKNTLKLSFPAISGAVTASHTELNALDGITSNVGELNILDGVTATAAELNYLDITTLGTGAASKAVVLDAGDDYTWPATGVLTYGVLNDGTTALTATVAEINTACDGITATAAEINTACDGITATAAEINTVCDGVLTGSLVWNPTSIAVNGAQSTTISVTGAAVGDFVIVAPGIDVQEMTFSGSVSATDTVEIVLSNNTVGAIDLGSSTWKVKVLK